MKLLEREQRILAAVRGMWGQWFTHEDVWAELARRGDCSDLTLDLTARGMRVLATAGKLELEESDPPIYRLAPQYLDIGGAT